MSISLILWIIVTVINVIFFILNHKIDKLNKIKGKQLDVRDHILNAYMHKLSRQHKLQDRAWQEYLLKLEVKNNEFYNYMHQRRESGERIRENLRADSFCSKEIYQKMCRDIDENLRKDIKAYLLQKNVDFERQRKEIINLLNTQLRKLGYDCVINEVHDSLLITLHEDSNISLEVSNSYIDEWRKDEEEKETTS